MLRSLYHKLPTRRLKNIALTSYRFARFAYRVIIAIPILGYLIRLIINLLRLPAHVKTLGAIHANTAAYDNYLNAASANLRQSQRTQQELLATMRDIESRVAQLEAALAEPSRAQHASSSNATLAD